MNRIFLFAACFFASASAYANDLQPFSTDGCSLFPEGNWAICCVLHDMKYYGGGTSQEKEHADESLKSCVIEKTGNEALGELMKFGVTVGGQPIFPTWFRWGYGWKENRGYEPLSQTQRELVDRSIEDAFSLMR